MTTRVAPEAPTAPDATAEDRRSSLASLVGTIAHAVDRALSPGDVASLRRLDPADPGSPAFWKLAAAYLEPAGALPGADPARADAERRWAAVACAAALLRGLHQPRVALGTALAGASFSEIRLVRLLRASDDRLLSLAIEAARFLAAKAQPVDLTDLARLVLSDGRDDSETARRRVARAYYSAASA